MKRSDQHVIVRMEKWNLDRTRERYTLEVARKIIAIVRGELKEGDLEVLSKDGISPLDAFEDLEAMAQELRGNIDPLYGELERVRIDKNYLYSKYPEMSPEFVDKHIRPIYEAVDNTTGRWVRKCRERVDDVFPDELSDKDIETAFMESFKSYDSYAGVAGISFDGRISVLELRRQKGEISQEEFEAFKRLYEGMKKGVSYLAKQIYGDLQR